MKQAQQKYPWTVALRSGESRPFEIRLAGDVSFRILREVDAVAGEDLETGGHLWAWQPAQTCDAEIVYATGAGVVGQLHGRRSLNLPHENDRANADA